MGDPDAEPTFLTPPPDVTAFLIPLESPMSFLTVIVALVAQLDVADFLKTLEPMFADVIGGRCTEEEAKTAIVASLDVLIDWTQIVPGFVGETLEAGDGQAIGLAVDWIYGLGHHKAVRAAKAAGALVPAKVAKPTVGQFLGHLFAPKAHPLHPVG